MDNNGKSMEFNCIKNNKENKGIYKAFNFNNRIKKEIFNLFKKKYFQIYKIMMILILISFFINF
jgi:hypothetical protein